MRFSSCYIPTLKESPAVVRANDLLSEVPRLDRGVTQHPSALPAADQPGQRAQSFGQVDVEFEHDLIVVWRHGALPRRQTDLRRRRDARR